MDKEDLINGYFENSLNQNQLEEVERLLKTDSVFASELEFQKELKTSLKKENRKELKNMFDALNEEETKAKTKTETKVFQLRPWLAAASIALLVGLGSWFLLFDNPDFSTDELYAANFAPYDNVVHPIERGNQLEDLKTKAFTAYENQEYVKALALFEDLGKKQNDSYLDFYSAMVLMQLNQQEKAIPLLEGYIEKEGELKERATWYLALSYLKLGEVTESKEALEALIETGSFKKKAAEKLLDNLN